MSLDLQRELERLRRLNRYLGGSVTHWCPIVSSKEIKIAITDRCAEIGVSLREVVLRADVSWNTVYKYWLNDDEPLSRPSLRAEDIIKIGELIRIKLRVSCIKGDADKVDRNKLLNDRFIPLGQRKKNKKLSRDG